MANDVPLLEQIARSPLLIDQNAQELFQASIRYLVSHKHADEFLASAAHMSEDDDFWPKPDHWLAQYRPYNVKNGILQIPVMGILLNRFAYQVGRFATGYAYIEKALERGMADANVRAVALVLDTPGGEVAGNFELVDKLYAARSTKPIRAFAADHAYSAGYSIASTANQIIVTRSGGVGSIGVVTAHVDYSEALSSAGIKITFIFAGKHKVDGNAYEKLPEATKARIQARIDKIYGVFTSTVARNRAMDEAEVRATEALTYDAEGSIEAKLADRIGSLEDEMIIFSNEIEQGNENMANDAPKTFTQEAMDSAVSTARGEGEKAGRAEGHRAGLTEGAAAERTRISAILASDEGKKRPKAAMSLAMKTSLSLEDAKATLADMPEEQTATANEGTKGKSHFEAAMEQGHVSVGAGDDADATESAKDDPTKMSASILKDYAGVAGIQRKKTA